MNQNFNACQIAKIVGPAAGQKPDPADELPVELRTDYHRAMEGLENPANERQRGEARAFAAEVIERIKRWRKNKTGAQRANSASADEMIADLSGATPAKIAGLPDGLRRQFEQTMASLDKAATPVELASARRAAEQTRVALEAHKSQVQAHVLFRFAQRTPKSFFEKD
jgi:hypothetical protein